MPSLPRRLGTSGAVLALAASGLLFGTASPASAATSCLGLVTAFVLAFNAVWGDFIAPNLLLDQSNTTLAVGVGQGYVNDRGFPLPNLLAGGAVLYLVPVILLFLAAQRSYVRGFVNSGLK
ncbi:MULTISPECIES: hypothetical protein [unclassified Streptomyces]|uniref:hypothetical protein n=1 Tax=unclassified Streptomyces TaxID=2593676 RepID=UPI00224D1A33|nr:MULTISPECIES: hypothetical protein [unclassified Streptomyces]MCX5049749.1 hypothetical protein [Streptomyces sp. NBC_00474]